jgi:hypothetical protein
MPQVGQPLKRRRDGTLHSLWLLLGIAVSAGVAVLFMKKEY